MQSTFEHAALGDVSMNVHSLIASATEVERLISTFRVMSLPAVDSDGGFVRYMQLSEEVCLDCHLVWSPPVYICGVTLSPGVSLSMSPGMSYRMLGDQ